MASGIDASDGDGGIVLLLYALAAPQGRAIDLGLRSVHALNDRWAVSVSLRTLEGGADNDSVYTFGWFGSATIGLSLSF